MLKLFEAPRHNVMIALMRHRQIAKLMDKRPLEIVAIALAIGFVVFLVAEVIGHFCAPYSIPTTLRIMHFAQGFVACGTAVALAGYIVSRKDSEIRERKLIEQALLEEREDFLAVINHRLRNSLLATDRIVKLLLNGDFGEFQPLQHTILEHVSDNNKEIDRLIRMLVDIYEYRNGRKQMKLIRCDLGGIINEVIARKQQDALSKSVELSPNAPHQCLASCDHYELDSLIEHIIENAIKHARSSVKVTARTANGFVHVAVTDDGIGIPEGDVPSLFDRFFVNSHEGKYPAVTGVGLCLCSEIAKAHGGKLTCESKFGTGTTFELTIPAA
jgi:two-component system sensor histidine kinase ResE